MVKQSFQCCLFFERIFEHKRGAEPPEEIKQLFDEYSENGTMSIENLLEFMIDNQKEKNATRDDAKKIFDSLKHLNIIKQEGGLTLDAFFGYLCSDLNPPLPPKDQDQVHHDMDAPLSHYYLYTGHNSYLTGNQFCSHSSVKPIRSALENGVRVIELDLWPKRCKKDVKVCHGGTLTSKVDLKKCLLAIKEHAFRASKYPLIITFEDHLTSDLQAQVAKMLKEIFGNMLCHSNEFDYLEEFPSPNSLKEKVLISTKPPKEYLETQDDPKVKRHLEKLKKPFKKHVRKTEKSYSQTESDFANKQDDEQDDGDLIEEEDEEKLDYNYRDLIAIHAMKFHGELADALLSTDQRKPRRLSMSEKQLENAVKAHRDDIVRFTQRNLLRVYPKGTRINSSNYDPHIGWTYGAQMVAFNMQGTGKYLWIMQAMFRANGGCGYVKKPNFLLKDVYNPNQSSQIKTTLKVKIYHGEGWHSDFHHTAFDLYSPPDLYTKIGIAGVPDDVVADDARQRTKTATVTDEWVPLWNKEFTFKLTAPELAVLCIEVFDSDKGRNDFAGQTCLPVSELRSGIRAVPLHNQKGDQYKHTRLLMRFQFE